MGGTQVLIYYVPNLSYQRDQPCFQQFWGNGRVIWAVCFIDQRPNGATDVIISLLSLCRALPGLPSLSCSPLAVYKQLLFRIRMLSSPFGSASACGDPVGGRAGAQPLCFQSGSRGRLCSPLPPQHEGHFLPIIERQHLSPFFFQARRERHKHWKVRKHRQGLFVLTGKVITDHMLPFRGQMLPRMASHQVCVHPRAR